MINVYGHAHSLEFSFLDEMIIKIDSRWKNTFDQIIKVICIYNVYSNVYYAAYRLPYKTRELTIDIISETF